MPPGKAQRLFWKGEAVGQFANLSSFAEQLLVHENAVVKIAEDIPLNVATLVGCGVITGAGAVINTAKVPAGSTGRVRLRRHRSLGSQWCRHRRSGSHHRN